MMLPTASNAGSMLAVARGVAVSLEAGDADDHMCPVCCEPIVLKAAGTCNHNVCHRCSLRLRVLCNTQDCPVCRSELKQVRT